MRGGGEKKKTWAEDFCRLNPVYTLVPQSFISDKFNLEGISGMVSNFEQGILNILRSTSTSTNKKAEKSSREIYTIIHSRYVITDRGLMAVLQKVLDGDYGYCPSLLCQYQRLLPYGIYDEPGKEQLMMLCPKCRELYKFPKHSGVDGATYGTSVANLLLMEHFDSLVQSTEAIIRREN